MSEEQNQLVPSTPTASAPVVVGFDTKEGFEVIQRMALMLSKSDLVPQQFKGNIANCIIGLEMARRMNASPLAVMQNLYIVHGKPGWSAQFIIAAINSTGKFSPLRFDIGEGTCVAWAIEKATGERLESPPVSIDMAKKEGWYDKSGSKWKTMPELMLRYRAATFFGRIYAPEVLMGMSTMEELADVVDIEPAIPEGMQEKTESKKDALKEKLKAKKQDIQKPVPDPALDDDTPLDEGEPLICPDSGNPTTVGFCNSRCVDRKDCKAFA